MTVEWQFMLYMQILARIKVQMFILELRWSFHFYEWMRDKWFCLLLHSTATLHDCSLEEYASLSSEGPEKTDVVNEAARYLQACHLIFEKGILSHVFIRSNESAVLKTFNIYLALQMCPHWTLFIKSLTLKLWCILFLMVIMVLRNLFFPAKFLKTLFRAGKVALHAP